MTQAKNKNVLVSSVHSVSPTRRTGEAGASEGVSVATNILADDSSKKSSDASTLHCPECRSQRVWKAGFRGNNIQRLQCRDCGHRFSEHQPLESRVLPNGAFRDLSEQKTETAAMQSLSGDFKGKIIEFAWWLKKNAYAETTIHTATNNLTILAKRVSNLLDPEAVKDVIALQSWSDAYKLNMCSMYTLFLKMLGLSWIQPEYTPVEKLPFIPTEKELDDLIAGSGKKTACFLELLKETGVRCGEIERLKWTEIDFETQTLRTTPEKSGKPRIKKLKPKAIGMLSAMPRVNDKVFGNRCRNNQARILESTRKVLANKLSNPRLNQIHLHTFRDWYATMLYHKTKDILYVMQELGHRNINNTLKYIQLAEALFKDITPKYTHKVARTLEEAEKLVDEGFEKWDEMDGVHIYRKVVED